MTSAWEEFRSQASPEMMEALRVSRQSHLAGNTLPTDLDTPSPHGKVHNLIFPLTNAFGSPFGIVFEVLLNSQDGIRIGRYLRFTVWVAVPFLFEWLVT